MRITKDAARSVAIKLTEKKQTAIDKLKADLNTLGFNAYKKTIPKKVLEFYELHPEYIHSSRGANFSGKGLNYERVEFDSKLPSKDNYSYPTVIADDSTCEKILSFTNKISDKKKELSRLQSEIENALLSLKTYTKITSEFKEAVPFLPFKEKNELVVNIKEIRAKL